MSGTLPSSVVSLLRKLDAGGLGFQATQVDGPDIDLIDVAGLSDLWELSDGLWGENNWEAVLMQCSAVEVIEEDEFESGPGASDTYYRVEVDDPERFALQLRKFMLAQLHEWLGNLSRQARKPDAAPEFLPEKVEVRVEWDGLDHTCPVDLDAFQRIVAGEPVRIRSCDDHEEEGEPADWNFNPAMPWSLSVQVEGRGECWLGNLTSADIDVILPPRIYDAEDIF